MKPVVKMIFGSHIYGTNTPSSDTDYKGVFIPAPRDIIMQRAPKTISLSTGNDISKNTKDDVDDDQFAFHYYIKQLLDSQTWAVDMLFTPKKFYINSSPEWNLIVENKHIFLNKDVSGYAGYCQAQAAKYSLKGSNLAAYKMVFQFFEKFAYHTKIKDVMDIFNKDILEVAEKETIYHDKGQSIVKIVSIPHKVTGDNELYIQVGHKTKVPINASCGLAADIYKEQAKKYGERAKAAESNNGLDFKALSHAVRVCREAEELLLTGRITFPLTDPVILDIKLGKIPFKEISDIILDGLDRVNSAKAISVLPDNPDYQAADDLIYEVYKKHIKNSL